MVHGRVEKSAFEHFMGSCSLLLDFGSDRFESGLRPLRERSLPKLVQHQVHLVVVVGRRLVEYEYLGRTGDEVRLKTLLD